MGGSVNLHSELNERTIVTVTVPLNLSVPDAKTEKDDLRQAGGQP
jgi:chemotaxis protein histidine kinase CheA